MKIVEINSVLYGSTGKIVLQIAEVAHQRGHGVLVCAPKGRHNKNGGENVYLFGNRLAEDSHLLLSRLTGLNGYFSFFSTKALIRRLQRINPDIVHLHNLHNSYINLPLLFEYLKKNNIRVVWTLHDCWAFTGHCPHFTMVKCKKWKTGCIHCPSYRDYPESFVDSTRLMWKMKKKWFCGVKDLTVVTPSQWLGNLVKESFLNAYPVRVINNGIDLEVFCPRPSDFRKNHAIAEHKNMILGVAFEWGIRKGIDVFIELAKRLNKDYQIVLVGVDEKTAKELPSNIITIHKTQDQFELAKIYTAADLFVNPTREENYPTVNMEALACGTPVLTFKTGGSPEIIDETCGDVVESDDIDQLENEIIQICRLHPFTPQNCVEKARSFNKTEKFEEYIKLYETN